MTDESPGALHHLEIWVADLPAALVAPVPDRHPHAGGPEHYAAYLENGDGFEVDLVASDEGTTTTP